MTRNRFVPKGYRQVTVFFITADADRFIRFVCGAFEGKELNRAVNAAGKITHAEVCIGDSIVECSDASESFPARTNTIHLFVEDTDACYARALSAGAESLYEPGDMPYGERSAGIADPFGNHWYLATFKGDGGTGYYG